MTRRVNTYLFWCFAFLFILSAFNRNSAKNVSDIAPEVLKAPIIRDIEQKDAITIVSQGIPYSLTPVSACEIHGIIVAISSSGLVWSYCPGTGYRDRLDRNKNIRVMWGSNAEKKIYKSPYIHFSEEEMTWSRDVGLTITELASIALITDKGPVWNRIQEIRCGDQVTITGTLVNLRSWGSSEYKTGTPGDNSRFWVVYVKDVRILKKANIGYRYLFWISLCGLVACVAIRFFGFSTYY